MIKDDRINKEEKRLRDIYKDLPKDVLKLYDGLIVRAAYMRITLEDYERDINENGSVDSFKQSADLPPYERARPVTNLYNTMNKNYQSIMKQLADRLPAKAEGNAGEDMLKKYVV